MAESYVQRTVERWPGRVRVGRAVIASALAAFLAAAVGCTSAPPSGLPATTPAREPSPIPSGVFVSANFHPSLTFRYTRRLSDARDDANLVTLDDGGPPQLYIMSVSQVYDPRSGQLAFPPVDMIAWLRSNPYLRTTRVVETTVGSLRARQLDATVTKPPPTSSPLSCAPGCVRLFLSGMAAVGVPKAALIRFIVVDVRGQPVTIEFETARTDFNRFAAAVRPVLDSMTFPAP